MHVVEMRYDEGDFSHYYDMLIVNDVTSRWSRGGGVRFQHIMFVLSRNVS